MGLHIGGGTLEDVHVAGESLEAIWVQGERVWPLTIESFEDGSNVSDHLRGSDTGSANITSDAALATTQGSTQGLHYEGFNERYALPGDHSPGLQAGREASFLFHPRDFDGGDQFHFLLAPQESADSPPDECYRFEFHMGGGSRITHIDSGGRDILDQENSSTWDTALYECSFTPDSGGVTMSCNGETLSTSNTDYVADVMGFGFRASGGGSVDYDWLSY